MTPLTPPRLELIQQETSHPCLRITFPESSGVTLTGASLQREETEDLPVLYLELSETSSSMEAFLLEVDDSFTSKEVKVKLSGGDKRGELVVAVAQIERR